MEDYGPSTYGERWADVYDAWVSRQTHVADSEQIAERLAEIAGAGPALELAIGTGRVALPLVARGVEVHGIDASQAMVAKLREKPGGDAVPVTIGDFADVPVDGAYPLAYVVFNTFFALLSQEEQVRCFRNVETHLADGGVFVMEAFVPDPTYYERGQSVRATEVEPELASFTVALHDAVEQRVRAMIVVLEGTRVALLPVQLRYAWPSEIDLMARLAGLRLRERWGGWDRSPFTSDSGKHVSIYERAPSG